MAVETRLIRRRIVSIKNMRKITKAMELVSASKMRRAVQMTLRSRAYADEARALVNQIMHLVDPATHDLIRGAREPKNGRTLLAVAASDRGMCGGFNTQILKRTVEFLGGRQEGSVDAVIIGRRAERAVRKAGIPITASFEAISNGPSFARALPIAKLLVDTFVSGKADRVFISYMKFGGAMKQIPTVEQILPIVPEEDLSTSSREAEDGEGILFEPNPSLVLDSLLPKLVETRIYQALLESSASEQSARMMAMRSASDNASTMLEDLTLAFNQARQAGITQEISEISAGKAAIE